MRRRRDFYATYVPKQTGFRRLEILGFGWEKNDPHRILQSFVREHFRVHYITGGSGYLEVRDQKYHLTEGYGFVIYPGVASNYYPDKEDPWEYFWLGMRGDAVQKMISQNRLTRSAPLFQITNDRADARLNLVNIYTSIIAPDLLEHSPRHYLQVLFDNVAPVIHTRYSQTYYFEKCLRFIHENYTQNIKIGDLAAALAVDRTYLYKIFMSNVQCSPQTYLINHRISKACDLLISTERSVSDIAYSVGFNDLSDFSKQFRKRNGMSAKAFREVSEEKGKKDVYF